MVAGNSRIGQDDTIVWGFTYGVHSILPQAKMFSMHLRSHQNRQAVLWFDTAINRCSARTTGRRLGNTEVCSARRTLGPFAGILVLGPKAATALACYHDRHRLARKPANVLFARSLARESLHLSAITCVRAVGRAEERFAWSQAHAGPEKPPHGTFQNLLH